MANGDESHEEIVSQACVAYTQQRSIRLSKHWYAISEKLSYSIFPKVLTIYLNWTTGFFTAILCHIGLNIFPRILLKFMWNTIGTSTYLRIN